jgi:sugar/nucleoside kinase (ribokinase family)
MVDIVAPVDNDEMFKKYGLTHGETTIATLDKMAIFDEAEALPKSIKIPGGSALNTIRCANFMLKDSHPKKCAFIGAIGDDDNGKIL